LFLYHARLKPGILVYCYTICGRTVILEVQNLPMPAKTPSAIKTILLTGFIAGTLDISAAIIFLGKFKADKVLQFIASGAIGTKAFNGGVPTILLGLGIHYFIAFAFTILYFLLYPRLVFLRKHFVLSGIIYGIFIWLAMNLVILRFSHVTPTLTEDAVRKGIIILIIMAGLPIAWLTGRYYKKKGK